MSPISTIGGLLPLIPYVMSVYDWLTSKRDQVEQAISHSCKELNVPGLKAELQSWVWSPEFTAFLGDLRKNAGGGIDPLVASLRKHLVVVGFKQLEPTEEHAKKILSVLERNLVSQILQSKTDGIASHHGFVVKVSEQNVRDHEEIRDKLDLLISLQEDSKVGQTEDTDEGESHYQDHANDLDLNGQPRGQFPATSEQDQTEEEIAALDLEELTSETDTHFDAKLDVVRGLMEGDRFNAAEQQLKGIEEEVKKTGASNRIEFRLATNSAGCAVVRGDLKEAASLYREAYELQPDNQIAAVNRAYASLLEGNLEEADRRSSDALEKSSHSKESIRVRIAILEAMGRQKEIDGLCQEKPEILKDSSIRFILGQIALRQHDNDQAMIHLREAIRLNKDNWQYHAHLAVSYLESIQPKLSRHVLVAPSLSEEETETVIRAVVSLDTAIALVGETDLNNELAQAVANRAAANAILGKLEEAKEDCNWALALDDKNYIARRNAGILAIEEKRYDEAIEFLKPIVAEKHELTTVVPLAVAYLRANRSAEAASLLESAFRKTAKPDEQLHLGLLLIESLFDSEGQGALKDLLTKFEGLQLDDATQTALRAEVFATLKDEGSRQLEINKLMARDVSALPRAAALMLADSLFWNNQYDFAATLYQSHLSVDDPTPLLERYTVSLYKANRTKQALRLAQQIRSGGPALKTISEVEAIVLEFYGYIEDALALYDQLAKLEPQEHKHRIRAIECQFRLGKEDSARTDLRELIGDLDEVSSEHLMQIAQIQIVLDGGDPLETLYEGLQRDHNNPNIQVQYFANFHAAARRTKVNVTPSVVDVDTVVTLMTDSGPQSYSIVSSLSKSQDRREVLVDSSLAKALLGASIGDKVKTQSTEGGAVQDRYVTIQSIRSKYVDALQEIADTFETRFAGHSGMQRVNIGTNQHAEVKLLVSQKHQFISRVRDLYEKGQLTLGTCGRISGHSVIDVWAAMVGLQKGRLFVSDGLQKTIEREQKTIADSKTAVVDLTAVLAIVHLEIEDKCEVLFEKILVPQAVIDEVSEELANYKLFSSETSIVLGMRDGEYVKQEITADDHKKHIQTYERIINWCRAGNREVVVSDDALGMNSDKYDELCKVVGRSSLDAILVAKQYSAAMFSDDLFLRKLAANEHGVTATLSSPAVLSHLHQSGVMTIKEYYESTRLMALSNFTLLQVDVDFLMWVLKEDKMKVTPRVSKVFNTLFQHPCSPQQAVEGGADVIRATRLEGLLAHQEGFVVDIICRILLERPEGRGLLENLRRRVVAKFELYPQPLPQIVGRIDMWLNPGGLIC